MVFLRHIANKKNWDCSTQKTITWDRGDLIPIDVDESTSNKTIPRENKLMVKIGKT